MGKKRPLNYAEIRFRFANIEMDDDYFVSNSTDFDSGDPLELELKVNYHSNRKDEISIKLGCSFYTQDRDLVLKFSVNNVFMLPNEDMKLLLKPGAERGFAYLLGDLSLSHARGLQAKIINNTEFKDCYLPIISASQFMANMQFDDEDDSVSKTQKNLKPVS